MTFLIFLYGLIIGSFLNVLIYRIPRVKALHGRAPIARHAPPLKWYDNIPLFSYLVLRGKCRYCGQVFPFSTP